MLAVVNRGKCRLITRKGNDWSTRFRSVTDAVESLGLDRVILDGEVVSLNEKGISDFQQLQNQLKRGQDDSLAYYLFDMPYFEGYDLTAVPLSERKALLERVLAGQAPGSATLRYSEHIEGAGAEVLQEACGGGLEGIVSKRVDSKYQQARSPAWLKSKCTKRQEFVIGGYTEPSGARTHFGALLLGYYNASGELKYAGKVGTGFTSQSLRDVFRELKSRVTPKPEFVDPPRGYEARTVTWIKPELVGEIEFTEWTEDGQLRHPSFQGLREDKRPTSVIREVEIPMPAAKTSSSNGESMKRKAAAPKSQSKASTKTATKGADEAVVAGVKISSPDRVVYPGYGVTKLDLARYYESVAEWVLPYVERRPLTLVRCPEGQASPCFYQKHINATMPKAVYGVEIMEKESTDTYLAVRNITGLISLVQMGVLEFHPWPARDDNVERPDMLVFDLDPGDDLEWKAVVQGAKDVRDCLEMLGLKSFLRTSGGKGLHIVAPLSRRNTWEELKEFARGVGETMMRAAPDRYVVNMSKAKRRGKIFVDYLRNQRGATAVASYSTRARSGAPVATPLAWDELSVKLRPNMYTVENIHKRLTKGFKDPWKDFFKVKQVITREMMRMVQG